MASRKTPLQVFFLLFLGLLAERNLIEAISCSTKERNALVTFKKGLNDTSNCLASWIGKNCCNWLGVGCSNRTGHVIKLDLHGQYFYTPVEEGNKTPPSCKHLSLGGKVSPSLLDLKYLTYLDLSGNDFQGIHIPNFVSSLTNLRHLDLSHSSFSGMIPPTLGNLSRLRHLDIRTSYHFTLWVSDLHWLPNLSSLQYLDLGSVNLSKATTHWLQAINMLPSLLELHLTGCELSIFPQYLPFVNFTSLQILKLSYNNFSSPIPPWVFNNVSTLVELELYICELKGNIPRVARGNLCSLQKLDLSFNSIIGEINEFIDALSECNNSSFWGLDFTDNKLEGILPSALGFFQCLELLLLSRNSFSGPIPLSLGNLSSLSMLDLSFNKLSGIVPESFGQLTKLFELSLWGNSWQGVISDIHLRNLTRLQYFSISSVNNSVVFDTKNGWIPPFSLASIEIDDCRLGPTFPAWLRTQTSLDTITLRRSGISGVVPYWFWKLSPGFWWLDLSNNQLRGELPNSTYLTVGSSILLGFNQFEGSIPIWPNVTLLSLRNNLLSGSIPWNIGQEMSQLEDLYLSDNFLTGSIPPSIKDMRNLSTLDISSNKLSGELFEQWMGLEKLWFLDLSYNHLSGGISISICSQLPSLSWLKLGGNNLSGRLPSSFPNCTSLVALDLRENGFSGTIPNWVNAEDMASLNYLSLRSNRLHGEIPEQLCHLPSLHVLDLAYNNLSGPIPKCLGNGSVRMKSPGYLFHFMPLTRQLPSSADLEFIVKGRLTEYSKIVSLVNLIDLSCNNLSGEIPEELSNLSRLGSLNLSYNNLMGKIPERIGKLQLLESLDLSWNHLSGPIPPSMTSMTALNYLNLSHNNLSGQIPSANQFQTLNDQWIYEDNPGLCGPPLPTKCSFPSSDDPSNRDQSEDEDGDHETLWFYASIALGYIVGFWAVCGTLLMNKSLRHAYFKSAYAMKEKLVVFFAIFVARLRRKLKMSAD